MTNFDSNEYDSDLIAGSHSIIEETYIKKGFEVAEDVELCIQEQNLISGCSGTVKVENLGDVTNESSALNKCFDIENNEQVNIKFDNTSGQVGFDENYTEYVAPIVMKCKEEVGLYECDLCELKTRYEDVLLRHFMIIHKDKENSLAEEENVVKSQCISDEVGSKEINEDYNVKCQESSEKEEVKPGGTKINLEAKISTVCSDDIEFVIPLKNSKEYDCKLCGLKTKYEDVFLRHFKIIHTDKKKSFQCKFCAQTFKTKHRLQAHVTQKHNESRNKCSFCDYSSRWRSALLNHIRYKHDEHTELLKCQFCSYTTKYKYYLKRHSLLVHDENSQLYRCELYCCPFCKYKTKHQHTLSVHIRCQHEKPQLHKCNLCLFVTEYKADLDIHLETRHGEKWEWYICAFCNYETKWKRSLQQHYNSIHHNPGKYDCQFCLSKFEYELSLLKHIGTKHAK